MRIVRVTAAVLILLLVGISSGPDMRFSQQSMVFLGSGTASATGPDSVQKYLDGGRSNGGMSEGAKLLDMKCSTCHSVDLIFRSGLLAGEADSVITCMERKRRDPLSAPEHALIALYLKNRLPRD